MALALRRDRFTATRLTEGALHSVGGVITDACETKKPLPLELCFRLLLTKGGVDQAEQPRA